MTTTAPRRRGRRGVWWVALGPEPYLAHCERCGGFVEKPPMPLPVLAMVKYLDYAVALHRDCREAPP